MKRHMPLGEGSAPVGRPASLWPWAVPIPALRPERSGGTQKPLEAPCRLASALVRGTLFYLPACHLANTALFSFSFPVFLFFSRLSIILCFLFTNRRVGTSRWLGRPSRWLESGPRPLHSVATPSHLRPLWLALAGCGRYSTDAWLNAAPNAFRRLLRGPSKGVTLASVDQQAEAAPWVSSEVHAEGHMEVSRRLSPLLYAASRITLHGVIGV